jgi:hypothetical protein
MKNKLYILLIIGIIALLWFAPIDLDRERAIANTGARQIMLFIFETTWVKVTVSIFLGLIALGLSNASSNNEE